MKTSKVKIKCIDDIILTGLLLEPDNEPKGIVQLNSATATTKEYYINFANYLVENSWAVIVYDYRGIGESKPEKGLKNCEYQYLDWSQKDMVAVLEFLEEKFPTLKKIIVGHSVGGQKVGMMTNHKKIAGMFTFATSSGYWGSMKFLSKIKTHYFFEILRPITHFVYGYTAVKRFGIMEDLPKNITNTWRDWCSVPNYFFNEKYSSTTSALGYYNELTFPIKMLWADDDYIVTQPNVTNFWKNVKSTGGIEITKISPTDFGLKEIGHFGFFRKKFKEKLWPIGLNAINNFL